MSKEEFTNKTNHMIVDLSKVELSYQESVSANNELEKDLENEFGGLIGEDVELKILLNNGHIKSARYFKESRRQTNAMDISLFVVSKDDSYIVRILLVQTRYNIRFVVKEIIEEA